MRKRIKALVGQYLRGSYKLLELYYWRLRAYLYFNSYGPEGISICIRKMPSSFIIPTLKKHGATVGKNCSVEVGLIMHRPHSSSPFGNLNLGDNVYIGENVILDLTSELKVGNDTAIGANCQIWTHTGDWTYDRTDEHDEKNPVRIGKAVIVYSGSIINQGVSIGDYARVGAGSVVLSDIEAKTFYAGVPAKKILKREF